MFVFNALELLPVTGYRQAALSSYWVSFLSPESFSVVHGGLDLAVFPCFFFLRKEGKRKQLLDVPCDGEDMSSQVSLCYPGHGWTHWALEPNFSRAELRLMN